MFTLTIETATDIIVRSVYSTQGEAAQALVDGWGHALADETTYPDGTLAGSLECGNLYSGVAWMIEKAH